MKLSTITPNQELSTAGIWKEFGPEIDGRQMRLRIAFNGNDNFQEKQARLMRNATQQMAGRELPQATQTKIQRRAMAGTVLTGWENYDAEDNTPIPDQVNGEFNEDEGVKLLTNPLVFQFVALISNRIEEFQTQEEAASRAAIKSGASLETEVGPQTAPA